MLGGNSMATLRLIPSTITDASQYPGVGYIYWSGSDTDTYTLHNMPYASISGKNIMFDVGLYWLQAAVIDSENVVAFTLYSYNRDTSIQKFMGNGYDEYTYIDMIQKISYLCITNPKDTFPSMYAGANLLYIMKL